jgi:hypothetical protein
VSLAVTGLTLGRLPTHDAANGVGDCIMIGSVHECRVAPEGFSKDWNVTGENRTAERCRLDRRKAEAFVQRQANEKCATAV